MWWEENKLNVHDLKCNIDVILKQKGGISILNKFWKDDKKNFITSITLVVIMAFVSLNEDFN